MKAKQSLKQRYSRMSRTQLISNLTLILTMLGITPTKIKQSLALAKTLRKKGRGTGPRKAKVKGKRRLKTGVHRVRIRGRMRRIRVLNNGRWRFLKG